MIVITVSCLVYIVKLTINEFPQFGDNVQMNCIASDVFYVMAVFEMNGYLATTKNIQTFQSP